MGKGGGYLDYQKREGDKDVKLEKRTNYKERGRGRHYMCQSNAKRPSKLTGVLTKGINHQELERMV